MKRTCTLLIALLLAGVVQAAEVYRTTDPKGQPVYTDRPDRLPAERLDIASRSTDSVEVKSRYEAEMKRYAKEEEADGAVVAEAQDARKARELTAEDQAKRCIDARQKYESLMNARRIYERGETDDDRRYLDSDEIDAARETARKSMEELCAGL
ncbi:MAG TPA: DUF4124 domain-containing protein [Steroidobacteraceae bacterium]|nr:DUF4124 domain-containing protein [Steroidobacteraceae bacterium]